MKTVLLLYQEKNLTPRSLWAEDATLLAIRHSGPTIHLRWSPL
jgi:hypothetical protein